MPTRGVIWRADCARMDSPWGGLSVPPTSWDVTSTRGAGPSPSEWSSSTSPQVPHRPARRSPPARSPRADTAGPHRQPGSHRLPAGPHPTPLARSPAGPLRHPLAPLRLPTPPTGPPAGYAWPCCYAGSRGRTAGVGPTEGQFRTAARRDRPSAPHGPGGRRSAASRFRGARGRGDRIPASGGLSRGPIGRQRRYQHPGDYLGVPRAKPRTRPRTRAAGCRTRPPNATIIPSRHRRRGHLPAARSPALQHQEQSVARLDREARIGVSSLHRG